MRVLVTGANGHIGSNVVRALVESGASVIALVRPNAERRHLDDVAGADVREGNILDPATLASAFEGVDVVIHTAAPHRNYAANADDILVPAVKGTKNVLDACAAANVKRLVLTSSAATVGFASDGSKPIDESSRVGRVTAPYVRAKVEQENLALDDGRVEVVVLNPSGVFGPGDYKLTPATRAFIGLLQGDPAFLTVSVTDVRDVARAHVEAAKRGKAGERYLITGDVLAPKALSEAFARVVGFGPKVMTPPRFLVGWLAWWQERKARSTGADASTTRAMIDDVWGKHLAYDSTKSRRELGMTYYPAERVIRDTTRWLLERDALKPSVAERVRAKLG